MNKEWQLTMVEMERKDRERGEEEREKGMLRREGEGKEEEMEEK